MVSEILSNALHQSILFLAFTMKKASMRPCRERCLEGWNSFVPLSLRYAGQSMGGSSPFLSG
eukprot:610895-Pelagomonas_calceolata.AAC.2